VAPEAERQSGVDEFTVEARNRIEVGRRKRHPEALDRPLQALAQLSR
jgi:hypothetical protein